MHRPSTLPPRLSPRLSPRLPPRSAWPGLAALVAVGALAAGSQALLPGLIWPARAMAPSQSLDIAPLKLGADGLALPTCIPNVQSPEMREWISQHPKSARGRLDHRRTALQARG